VALKLRGAIWNDGNGGSLGRWENSRGSFLWRLNAGSLAMAEHKFKIGQRVYIHPKPLLAPRGPYKIIDRLPTAERGFQYLIRSEDGLHECIVREKELRGA
jgi:hypothetical protein